MTRKWMSLFIVSMLLVFVTGARVSAQEEPVAVEAVTAEVVPAAAIETPAAEVSAIPEASAEKDDKVPWFGNVQLWEIIGAFVVAIWALIKGANATFVKKWKRILAWVEAGVAVTYDKFVRSAKAAAPEGKLSQDQIDSARGQAWDAAKAYAKESGMDLAKEVAIEYVPVLISKAVTALKGK